MTVFVDTSALFALLDEDDHYHQRAANWLSTAGRDANTLLATHSYVVVEAAALVHRRLGGDAVRVLLDAYIPAVSVLFVDQPLHRAAVAAYLAGLRRGSSFVDRVSMEFMREQRINEVFTFDADFADEGFTLVA